MKVYRTMSLEEFKKFINGETLIASNKPSLLTSAVEPKFYFSHDMHDVVLFGVEHDVICEFEVDESVLENGTGNVEIEYDYKRKTYSREITEYQISQYNSQMMKLTNCVLPDFFKILEEYKDSFEEEIEYWQVIREEAFKYSPEERLRYEEDFSNVYPGAKLFEINGEELKKIISERLDTSEITTEVLGRFAKKIEQGQLDRFLGNIDILNFINKFDYNVLLKELQIQELNVESELDREEYYLLNGHYPEDEQEEYNSQFEDGDRHTPDEIADGISSIREGELNAALDETVTEQTKGNSQLEKPEKEQGDN